MDKYTRLRKLWGDTGAELGKHLEQLDRRIADLEVQVAQINGVLGNPARDAATATTGIERELISYRESLRKVARDVTARRDDLGRNEEAVHRDIAREFHHFVGHHLYEVVRDAVGSSDERVIARRIAALSHVLFQETGESVRPEAATEWLAGRGLDVSVDEVAELSERVGRMKERGDRTGFPAHWDFTVSPGAPVDPDTQQVWVGSDDAAPVEMVVSPAYVVGDQVMCPQNVMTAAPVLVVTSHDEQAPR